MQGVFPLHPDTGRPGPGRAHLPQAGSSSKPALLALVACLVLASASPAVAQQPTPTPSAEELWKEYPLSASPEPAPTARAQSPPDGRRVSAPAAASGGGDGSVFELAAGLVFALGAMAALWTFRPSSRRRRNARKQGGSAPPDGATDPPKRAPEPAADGRRAQSPLLNAVEARLADVPRAPAAAPQAVPTPPSVARSAEIRWVETESGARFVASARSGDHEDASVVAESPSLEWPPTGPAAVQALSDAVEELERTMLAAGWSALPAGREWYAKRFAWKPAVAAPAADRPATRRAGAPRPVVHQPAGRGGEQGPTGRFRRDPDWPAES
jgi:hypothetical protein